MVQIAHVELEAALRALSVFEILGNLHCYNEDTCAPDMRDLFAKLLSAELQHCGPSAAGALQYCPAIVLSCLCQCMCSMMLAWGPDCMSSDACRQIQA